MGHLTASVAGQLECWSAACMEIPMSRPLGTVLGSVWENPDIIPSKVPHPMWVSRPHLKFPVPTWIHIQPKRNILIGSAIFAGLRVVTDRQTEIDRQTNDRPCYSICSNRLHLASAAMQPNNTEPGTDWLSCSALWNLCATANPPNNAQLESTPCHSPQVTTGSMQ